VVDEFSVVVQYVPCVFRSRISMMVWVLSAMVDRFLFLFYIGLNYRITDWLYVMMTMWVCRGLAFKKKGESASDWERDKAKVAAMRKQ